MSSGFIAKMLSCSIRNHKFSKNLQTTLQFILQEHPILPPAAKSHGFVRSNAKTETVFLDKQNCYLASFCLSSVVTHQLIKPLVIIKLIWSCCCVYIHMPNCYVCIRHLLPALPAHIFSFLNVFLEKCSGTIWVHLMPSRAIFEGRILLGGPCCSSLSWSKLDFDGLAGHSRPICRPKLGFWGVYEILYCHRGNPICLCSRPYIDA